MAVGKPNTNIEQKAETSGMVAARPEIREASTEASNVLRTFQGGKIFAALSTLAVNPKPVYDAFKTGVEGLRELVKQADSAGKTVAANRYEMEIKAKESAYPDFAEQYRQDHEAA